MNDSDPLKLNEFNPQIEFEEILFKSVQYLLNAQSIKSPNPQDDLFIKCAMVGFCRHASLDDWSIEHFRVVKERRENLKEDYEFWGGDAIERFDCLCVGALLALEHQGKLTETQSMYAEAMLPGFIGLKNETITNNLFLRLKRK